MAAADLVTRVVFALERDAKTDPPERSGEYFPTDVGILLYDANRKSWGEWVEVTDEFFPALPQPRVWYDFPRDTERETLTAEDLALVLAWAEEVARHTSIPVLFGQEVSTGITRLNISTARLRAALDALNT